VTARAGDLPAAEPSRDCVEVEIGNDRATSLGCLNQRFERAAQLAHEGKPMTAPITAQSPSNVVGTANRAAAQEMMGDAFGKSAIPQRPKAHFNIPLLQTSR